MELDPEALRALAQALEVIRDALDEMDPEGIERSRTISAAVQQIGEALYDSDLASSAGPAETDPR